MRTYLVFICLFVFACLSCQKSFVKTTPEEISVLSSPDLSPWIVRSWTKIPDIPRPRERAYAFAINLKGYVGGGWGSFPSLGNSLKDLWQFDPALNTWKQKSDLPGLSRERVACFVVGSKAYITTGYHNYSGAPDPNLSERYLNETWEYDPAVDQWTKKADFPGGLRQGAVGMSINGKGYVGLGKGLAYFMGIPVTTTFSDWWEFDPSANTWTKKKSFPGVARDDAVAAALVSYGYVGTGQGANDWWQYNSATDNWTQKSPFPGVSRGYAVAVSSVNIGASAVYVATGSEGVGSFLNDLRSYNPATDQWTHLFSMPVGRRSAAAFILDNTIYIGSGSDPHSPFTPDFWSLDL